MTGRPSRATALGAALSLSAAPVAHADPGRPSETACVIVALPAARRWPAPLDRTVSLAAGEITLREALDRLAATGRFRLSYAAELLPLDRRVCGTLAGVSGGDALVALLAGTPVEPIVVADDLVVLAPSRGASGGARVGTSAGTSAAVRAVPDGERPVGQLERVLVTENARADARASAVARSVVDGASLAARGEVSLAGALDAVPGVWVWAPSPSAMLARWGSLRGASAFGVSGPKIYVDGVEVANPLLVTGLVPEAIERVEVIRGPQGAALYGADAIGGVIDIGTRHDGAADGEPRVRLRSDAGPSRSDFSGAAVLAQHHALAARSGAGARTAGLALSLGTLGDFVPGGASRELAAHGDARLVGARSTLALTARLLDKSAGAAQSPILSLVAPPVLRRSTRPGARGAAGDSAPTFALDSAGPQSMRQYTLGATATFAEVGRWTPRATLGVDGYRLSGATSGSRLLLSAADSALRAARGGADRLTMRIATIGRFGDAARRATVTLAAEHTELHEATALDLATTADGGTTSAVERAWSNSTGVVAQTNVALHDALFLTGGVRLERDAGYGAPASFAALPTLGAAAVRGVAGATVKLRGAYGRAIRPPRAGARAGGATLGTEAQSGVEAGADVSVGDVALHVTRFDQRASGLLQSVALADAAAWPSTLGLPLPRRVALRNAGQIANRGWELEGGARRGRLALAGTLSLVDSRVTRVAPVGLVGDLRAGDRTLDVPARTMTLSATWAAPRWSATWGIARATDWIGYDRVALARALTRARAAAPTLDGDALRAYWRTYGGITRVRASATRDLAHGLSLTVAGDNLLDRQRGEPDDATVVPGRTLTLGVRAKF